MSKSILAGAVLAALISTPALAQQASPYDELRRDIGALAERLEKLEAENAELKARNERLEGLVLAPAPAPTPPATPAPTAASAPAPSPADAGPAANPWSESYRISGYVIADAYAVLGSHDLAADDQTGFWIRRGYLTFDTRISDTWSSRLRFEVNSPGDFKTDAKMTPFVKDAHLAWRHDGKELYMGISSSPTWEFAEGFWGYRSIEKTPLDLYRMGSSRDLGLAYKAKAMDGKVFYHAMLGNGAGEGGETNEGKKGMFSFGFRPTDALVAELYADYEDRPGNTDRTTYHAFLGWKGAGSRYGLEYGWQDREVEAGPDLDVAVASAFGVWGLSERSSLVARWDHAFDGFPDAGKIPYIPLANDTGFDLAILGLDYALHERVNLIPNVEYVMYRDTDGSPAPDDDLLARMTLYYQF
jgi:hypothetical protein